MEEEVPTDQNPPGKRLKPFDPINFVLSRTPLILGIGLPLFVLLAPLALVKRSPVYQANGSMLILPRIDAYPGSSDKVIYGNLFHFAQTQARRMTTEEVLLDAVRSMPRERWPAFLRNAPNESAAAAILRSRIKVSPVDHSYHLFVMVQHGQSGGLDQAVNAVMEAYIRKLEREQENQCARRLEYLELEIENILAEIEEKKARQGELSRELKTRSFNELKNPYYDRVITLQQQYLLARANQAEAASGVAMSQRNREVIGGLALDIFAEDAVARNEAVYMIDNWTYAKLQELRGTIDGLTPNNPDRQYVEERMKAMEEYLEDFKKSLNADFLRILTEKRDFELNEKVVRAQAEEEASRDLVEKLRASWEDGQNLFERSTELIAEGAGLDNDIEHLKQRLSFVEENIRNVTLQAKGPLHVRIEEWSVPPSGPVSDNLTKLLAMIFVFSFGCGGATGLALEVLDARIRGIRDLRGALGTSSPEPIPVYGDSDETDWRDLRVVRAPDHASSRALRRLVVRLDRERTEEGGKLFMVTGTDRGGGAASVFARNVAVAMRPYVDWVLYVRIERASENLAELEKKRPAREQFLSSLEGRIEVQGQVGRMTLDPSVDDLRNREALLDLLRSAGQSYDVVIVDCPVLIESDLTQFLAGRADSAIVVAEDRRTLYPHLRRTIEFLYRSSLKSFTAVLVEAKISPLEKIIEIRNRMLESMDASTIPGLLRSLRHGIGGAAHHNPKSEDNPTLSLSKIYRAHRRKTKGSTVDEKQ